MHNIHERPSISIVRLNGIFALLFLRYLAVCLLYLRISYFASSNTMNLISCDLTDDCVYFFIIMMKTVQYQLSHYFQLRSIRETGRWCSELRLVWEIPHGNPGQTRAFSTTTRYHKTFQSSVYVLPATVLVIATFGAIYWITGSTLKRSVVLLIILCRHVNSLVPCIKPIT